MSLPSSITSKSHYDAGTDDPKQARAQLAGLRDDVETINEHLKLSPLISPATPLGIGDGLESNSGALRAKLNSSPGIARAAAGLSLDISSLAALTSPAVADLLGIYDADGAANNKITLADALKVIAALTADASPDVDADYVMTYDDDAAAVKKVLLSNIGAGGLDPITQLTPSAVTNVEVTGMTVSNYAALLVLARDIDFSDDGERLEVQLGDGSYETGLLYSSCGIEFRHVAGIGGAADDNAGALRDAWWTVSPSGSADSSATTYTKNNMLLLILNPNSTQWPQAWQFFQRVNSNADPTYLGFATHTLKAKTKITRLKFMTKATGTMTGTIDVYGIKAGG